MLTHENVLKGGHIGKETDVLIGPRDSELGDLIRAEAVDGGAFEENLTFIAFPESCNAIKERSLPCPVGSDNADDGFFGDVKVYCIDSYQSAKTLGYFLCFQDVCHDDLLNHAFSRYIFCISMMQFTFSRAGRPKS